MKSIKNFFGVLIAYQKPIESIILENLLCFYASFNYETYSPVTSARQDLFIIQSLLYDFTTLISKFPGKFPRYNNHDRYLYCLIILF